MGDHVVLHVDRLTIPNNIESRRTNGGPGEEGNRSGDENGRIEEEEPLIQMVECRICQEEDHIRNVEIPCACNGSLKFAHRACVQRWCNEKGDITCEICHETYRPGYSAPPLAQPNQTIIDISSRGWTISGTSLDLTEPRLLAIAAAQRHIRDTRYDEYDATDASGAAFCRSAALILFALLLLRHALAVTNGDGDDDDASTIFSLFLLRAAGFLLPCYIMAWAISILQRRRQRQEAAAVAATEVALILQSAFGPRNVNLSFRTESSSTVQQESHQ